jgi:hypothetical protein
MGLGLTSWLSVLPPEFRQMTLSISLQLPVGAHGFAHLFVDMKRKLLHVFSSSSRCSGFEILRPSVLRPQDCRMEKLQFLKSVRCSWVVFRGGGNVDHNELNGSWLFSFFPPQSKPGISIYIIPQIMAAISSQPPFLLAFMTASDVSSNCAGSSRQSRSKQKIRSGWFRSRRVFELPCHLYFVE